MYLHHRRPVVLLMIILSFLIISSRESLADSLRSLAEARGIEISAAVHADALRNDTVYKETLARDLEAGTIDCVTFTASSTVTNFVAAFGPDEAARLLADARVACIGPITADTARQNGLRVDTEAAEYTIPGLVQAVVDLFAADPAPKGR